MITYRHLTIVAVVGLLAACAQVTPSERPSQVVEVNSTTASGEPVTSLELAAGETRWIRVNIPPAQRGADRRIVVEAHFDEGRRELDLVLFEPDRVTATASTSGTAFFRPGLQGIGGGFVGTALGTGSLRPFTGAPDVDRSVSVEGFCFGPCIARRAPSSLTHVYARITNSGNTNTTVPFYAYTEPFIDERSPENDTSQGAVAVSTTQSYRGAIEVLGDVDWVRFEEPGTIVVTQREGYDVNLRIELYDQTDTFVEAYGPGEPFVVIDGDRAAIGSDPQAQRASVYGFYDVDYQ
jgi:hypothetical protein